MSGSNSPDSRMGSSDGTSPASPPAPAAGTKQCWECLRRRIVCDMWQPVCNKCHLAGIVCPGYNDNKPLTWLAPGKVVSRPRKRKSPAAIPKKGQTKEAVTEKPTSRDVVPAEMGVEKVPHILELSDELTMMFEAAYYYNTHIYPDLVNTQLVPNLFIVPFEIYPWLTTSQRHILVTVAISHRMFQIPGCLSRSSTSELSSRLHYHRGVAIRALNDELSTKEGQCSDGTISSVMLFMYSDVQQVVSGNWRTHARGIEMIFEMRGGIRQMIKDKPHMRIVVLAFIISAFMGNTTTPAANQITTNSQSDVLDLFSELYEEFHFPVFPCPSFLMRAIIKINDLRYRFATAPGLASFGSYVSEASDILDGILAFSPEQWVMSKETFEDDWLVQARGCRSSVFLYCASSLRQLLGTMPADTNEFYNLLISDLRVAMANPRLNRCMMWPLVVAGEQAVNGTLEEREWINKELADMSRTLGSYSPLAALDVLNKYWSSGKDGWDECFNEPLVFIS